MFAVQSDRPLAGEPLRLELHVLGGQAVGHGGRHRVDVLDIVRVVRG